MSGMRLDDQSLEDLEMLAPAQAFSTALADIAASDIQNTMLEDEGGIFNRAGALASPAVEAGGSEQSAAGMPFNRDDHPENVMGMLEADGASPTAAATKKEGRSKPGARQTGNQLTGSRGGGRKATEAGMVFKSLIRVKYGSDGTVYHFVPSRSYVNSFRKMVDAGLVESEMSAQYDSLPPHLISHFQANGLPAVNYIKISPLAKMRLIEAFIAPSRSLDKEEDLRLTWQRITQILSDMGFLAVRGSNCASGRHIFSGNSDFHYSLQSFNENGHRCCPGGRPGGRGNGAGRLTTTAGTA